MALRFADRARLALSVTARALMTPVAFGVSALVLRRDRVALVRHTYSRAWCLPGGGLSRAEAAPAGLLRELNEEIGLSGAQPPELFGLYVRTVGLVTNHVALYRVTGGEVTFRPNFEISEMMWADPEALPDETDSGALHRLAEFTGKTAISPHW